MPRLEYFLIAESVSVDQSTNRLSVFNILEEIRILPLPQGIQISQPVNQLIACSSWLVGDEDRGQTFRVSLHLTPAGQPTREISSIEFVGDRKRQRLLQLMVGMPLAEVGDAVFELRLNDNREASHTVTVMRLEQLPPELVDAIEQATKQTASSGGFTETPTP